MFRIIEKEELAKNEIKSRLYSSQPNKVDDKLLKEWTESHQIIKEYLESALEILTQNVSLAELYSAPLDGTIDGMEIG